MQQKGAFTRRYKDERRQIAAKRANELRTEIADYLKAKEAIPTGFTLAERTAKQKKRLLSILGGTEEDWNNWHWQLANRIDDADLLGEILDLSPKECRAIAKVGKTYRWAISPYYASLMGPTENCPIRKQAVPTLAELDCSGEVDPMAEEYTSPAPGITRRYPDRLIINVTNQCAMFCRHCQRRRLIGEDDHHSTTEKLEAALDYIRANPEIRDVLLTGGDALMLSDEKIDWLLGELDKIEHVEIKRLGTRTPVTLPQRITPELCAISERHHPVYINTHFNTAQEVTPEAAEACARLAKAGVPLGNQAVLLRGINDHPHLMKRLNQALLQIRVRPYYIFHAKCVIGTMHFRVPVEVGINIMENLRGQTSGLAVPTYIINAPGGLGKTPILPQYLISADQGKVLLRTWEGKVVEYPNPLPTVEVDPEEFKIHEQELAGTS